MTYTRRLLPLFISDFFIGLMFHWPVMFPFMSHLGINAKQIGLYLIACNCAMLVTEIPSGIIADRWSRKGVALLGILAHAVGIVLFARAQAFHNFVVAGLFISVYFAASSGMKEAIMYDLLLEDDRRQDYERQLGRLRTVSAVATVIGSLLGGVVASAFGFPAPFYMSTISCVLAFLFLTRFREPQLHKQIQTAKLVQHITDLVRFLSRHSEMRLLVVTSVLVGIEMNFMGELDQLWPIALSLAVVWYGPLNALLMLGMGLAEPLSAWTAKGPRRSMVIAAALVLASTGLLVRNIWIVAFSEFLLLAMAVALRIVLSGRMQDELPSSHRSGAESAVSTITSLVFIGVTFAFSYVADVYSVFTAAWIVVFIALLAAAGVRFTLYGHKVRSLSQPAEGALGPTKSI